MTRREKIAFLLDHWGDIFDPAGEVSGVAGDGERIPLMPKMTKDRSILELVDCVQALGRFAPNTHAHLMAYYTAPWRITQRRVPSRNAHGILRRDKRGNVVTELEPTRERRLPDIARGDADWHSRCVIRGVDFVCAVFRGEPFIPDALLDAAA